MKKILTVIMACGICACAANAFPETSSANTDQMYQLQNLDRFKDPSMTDFENYRTKRAKRQKQMQQIEERQEMLEERAENTPANVQFVNENGVIKIERK